MDKHYVLSKDDITIIRELVRAHRLEENRTTNRPGIQPFVSQSTDVYAALTPGSGIAALTPSGLGTGSFYQGDEPGVAPCYVYRIIYQHGPVGTGTSQSLVPVLEQTTTQLQLVFNIGEQAIDGDVWIKVAKDKFGAWLAIDPPAPKYKTGNTCSYAGDAVGVSRVGSSGNWVNPSRAVGPPDGLFAVSIFVTATPGPIGYSDYLLLTKYGLGSLVPSTAVVDGFTVTVTRKSTQTNPPDTVVDDTVTIYLNGFPVSSNQASSSVWSTTTETKTYTFPASGLIRADLDDPTLGVVVSGLYQISPMTGIAERLNIDAVQMCVRWHTGTPPIACALYGAAIHIVPNAGQSFLSYTKNLASVPTPFRPYDTNSFLTSDPSNTIHIEQTGTYNLWVSLTWDYVPTTAEIDELQMFANVTINSSSFATYYDTCPVSGVAAAGSHLRGTIMIVFEQEFTAGDVVKVAIGASLAGSSPGTGSAGGPHSVSVSSTFGMRQMSTLTP